MGVARRHSGAEPCVADAAETAVQRQFGLHVSLVMHVRCITQRVTRSLEPRPAGTPATESDVYVLV